MLLVISVQTAVLYVDAGRVQVMSKKQVTAKPLNLSHIGGVTSSTARRILDTLEKMSSPISVSCLSRVAAVCIMLLRTLYAAHILARRALSLGILKLQLISLQYRLINRNTCWKQGLVFRMRRRFRRMIRAVLTLRCRSR